MAAGTQSAAGATLGISSAAPATYNIAGFEALTYTNVGEITTLGEWGQTYQIITSQVLSRRGDKKRKGTFNAGSLSFSVELDSGNTGQTAMQTALASFPFSYDLTVERDLSLKKKA